ncbi:KedN5 family methylcobalamin-dependent radical SAM C-methyltransferase [Amycolatopsis sp. VC5-11]|uniref:KedN5 family methylcobalamin-dependent radical SAM C-methyltransferase n=1 Tax=Amycolatopsis sp. VC5-11 TaxID=3120156 RepID=UPI0030082442
MEKKRRALVFLVQQGVWEMPLESMPLASGYLKATAEADDRIAGETEIVIRNFRGGKTLSGMANTLFSGRPPDVLAFSVLGWNYRAFGALAETFKQINPAGWVVFGGTHVAEQAERVFRMFPEVDVVVNGEGEFAFRDLLHAYLDRVPRTGLGAVEGISYRDPEGSTVTTPARKRIADLDEIPSPFLTGALEMTDEEGRFRYDVALMETNRGCPYKCAFCYWGGAIGQKVRAFSRERLRAELEHFAKLRVHTIVLCDANFGLLPIDVEFVDALIDVREQYGFPRALETSWAKNKSKTFYEIVRKMKQADLRSSFTLALQTLDEGALERMNRRNMKVNDWEDLADWLVGEGFDLYAELIWGAPGETIESFMEGYDKLARRVSRIACYPMLLLPNTDYSEKKEEFGLITVRGDHDDFEYLLANETVSFRQNQQMQRFLFWARVLAEMAVLRHTWAGLREFGGISQSEALRSFGRWVEETDDPAAPPLRAAMESAIAGTGDLVAAISFLYTDPAAESLLRRWWRESVRNRVPAARGPVLDEIFEYDLLTRPVCEQRGGGMAEDGALPVVEVRGEDYYLRAGVELRYDVPGIIAAVRAGAEPDLRARPVTLDLYYKTGAESAVNSTNHETIVHFMGMSKAAVLANAAGGGEGRGDSASQAGDRPENGNPGEPSHPATP